MAGPVGLIIYMTACAVPASKLLVCALAYLLSCKIHCYNVQPLKYHIFITYIVYNFFMCGDKLLLGEIKKKSYNVIVAEIATH